ncbi:LacI family DNA-binding transcriptional regulator [Microvirga sp. VF16]|uniref:LacI family DNA-binding transcriptional regulator n=1 Tax=Microvirga sp. VF16 TaxID=2807101 RepID=UPI00193EC1D8|nr:LacI family DNA-binding transcriptional regulator [Microvirga sp. VF16]QRM29986.1 LacI family DNA-binding transcriptional regulator [Microvirga sp. VF16]
MSGRKEKLTIKQVAEAAGVARSSVSRAFSRPEMLSPETVRRVLEAAEKLGYVPNQTARALSTGRHGNVALIVPDIANPFFPPLIRAAQMEADRSDFCVFLGNSDEDPKQEDKLVGRFSGQVEGLILASSRLSDERIRAHAAQRPLVLINRDVEGIPRVLIDSGSGVREAVAHLAGLGHRHIVYVAGPATSWSNKQRRLAVRKAAERSGLKVDVVAAAVASYDAGREVVAAILATGATAAIAFDDLMAQGILGGLSDRKIRVPDQFSIVGCDDVLGAATYPSLTTVSNRSVEAGKAALSLLLELLQSQPVRDIRYVLDTHLVVRNTTILTASV